MGNVTCRLSSPTGAAGWGRGKHMRHSLGACSWAERLAKRDVHRVVLTLGVELRLIGDPRARNLAAAEFCHQPLTCELAAKGILPRLPSQHDWLTAYQVR